MDSYLTTEYLSLTNIPAPLKDEILSHGDIGLELIDTLALSTSLDPTEPLATYLELYNQGLDTLVIYLLWGDSQTYNSTITYTDAIYNHLSRGTLDKGGLSRDNIQIEFGKLDEGCETPLALLEMIIQDREDIITWLSTVSVWSAPLCLYSERLSTLLCREGEFFECLLRNMKVIGLVSGFLLSLLFGLYVIFTP